MCSPVGSRGGGVKPSSEFPPEDIAQAREAAYVILDVIRYLPTDLRVVAVEMALITSVIAHVADATGAATMRDTLKVFEVRVNDMRDRAIDTLFALNNRGTA